MIPINVSRSCCLPEWCKAVSARNLSHCLNMVIIMMDRLLQCIEKISRFCLVLDFGVFC